MDFPLNLEPCDCTFIEQDINKCPFLKNINKPTNFSLALNFPVPSKGAKGPIFEDGPNFNLAFKHFHGKDGVLPLNGNSSPEFHKPETDVVPEFNHLASTAASISMSAFGSGGPFGFHSFFGKKLNKESESSRKEDSAKGGSSEHEALGKEWFETGNCPIAKSYRAASGILPLVATALRPPPRIKLKCPPAIVAARTALARTALVTAITCKNTRHRLLGNRSQRSIRKWNIGPIPPSKGLMKGRVASPYKEALETISALARTALVTARTCKNTRHRLLGNRSQRSIRKWNIGPIPPSKGLMKGRVVSPYKEALETISN